MNSGIYKLSFQNSDKVYIGQSVDIDRRFSEHIRALKVGKHTDKLLSAYKLYGQPTLEVLCICNKDSLNIYENIFIKYYNSYKHGLNSVEFAESLPQPDNKGVRHGLSKYTEEQIVQVLQLLIEQPFILYPKISEITGVGYQTIANIASLSEHTWLKDELPEDYAALIALKGKRNFGREVNTAEIKGIKYPAVVSPEGVIYDNITNVSKFMREHNIRSKTFYQLLSNKIMKTVGWSLL